MANSNSHKNGSAGFLNPVNPNNNSQDKKEGPSKLRKAWNFAVRNSGRALILAAIWPILAGVHSCTVNTNYSPLEYDALEHTVEKTVDWYKWEAEKIRDGARFATKVVTLGQWEGPNEAGLRPQVTYGSTPHVKICTPVSLELDVKNQDPEAMSYYAAVMKQIDNRIEGLNDVYSGDRQRNPDKDFVIMVHKKPADFNAHHADRGLQSLITVVAVEKGSFACPPQEVLAPGHRNYMPEFNHTSYSPSWKSVPGLVK
jgi:hypothetical protein